MGKPKKYDRRTINFGDVGHPARNAVDAFLKKHGSNELSKLIRKLVMFYFYDDPAYDDIKKKMLVAKRQIILDKMHAIHKDLQNVNKELDDKGVDIEAL